MKYVALLRGINVGGNSIIKMADLKKAVEDCGFSNVSTYIASGNVLFESDKTNKTIAEILEEKLSKIFNITLKIVIRSYPELKKAVDETPIAWKTDADSRKYMAFVREPVQSETIAPEVELKEGVDFLDSGKGVLYMTTTLSGITKSRFSKMASKPFYKDITIRNYNTVQKILGKME